MTVGNPIRLTRRDRRVYAVALGAVRAHIASVDQWTPHPVLDVHASLIVHVGRERLRLDSRVARARWALFLRALLRADEGDYGPQPVACRPCWGEGDGYGPSGCPSCYGTGEASVRVTPLWELAPKMGTAKARAR